MPLYGIPSKDSGTRSCTKGERTRIFRIQRNHQGRIKHFTIYSPHLEGEVLCLRQHCAFGGDWKIIGIDGVSGRKVEVEPTAEDTL